MLRHPWSATLVGRRLLGPNALRRTEYLHATLVDAGLDEPDWGAATHALANYVMGSGLTQSTWEALNDAGTARRRAPHLAAYPTLTARGHLDRATKTPPLLAASTSCSPA